MVLSLSEAKEGKKTRHQQRDIIVAANTEQNSCVIASELYTHLQTVNRKNLGEQRTIRFLLYLSSSKFKTGGLESTADKTLHPNVGLIWAH